MEDQTPHPRTVVNPAPPRPLCPGRFPTARGWVPCKYGAHPSDGATVFAFHVGVLTRGRSLKWKDGDDLVAFEKLKSKGIDPDTATRVLTHFASGPLTQCGIEVHLRIVTTPDTATVSCKACLRSIARAAKRAASERKRSDAQAERERKAAEVAAAPKGRRPKAPPPPCTYCHKDNPGRRNDKGVCSPCLVKAKRAIAAAGAGRKG